MQKLYPVLRKGRFYHSYSERRHFVILPSIRMYIRSFLKRFRRKTQHETSWLADGKAGSWMQGNARITWIGHASFLIRVGDKVILTDPIWGNATFLFKRIMHPPIDITSLPPIDYVLISHNHRDHMDEDTLCALKKHNPRMKILVPHGDKRWFDKRSIDLVRELFWWDDVVESPLRFTFLPARHWAGRGLHDRNRSLWGSWMIEHPECTLYFAGDTAYWKHFACIRHYFPQIDVALMPIGPCEPYKNMRHSHLNADLAVRAFCDLGAHQLVPMHWGTFYFGEDTFSLPIERLKKTWRYYADRLKDRHLHIVKFGDSVSLDMFRPVFFHTRRSLLHI